MYIVYSHTFNPYERPNFVKSGFIEFLRAGWFWAEKEDFSYARSAWIVPGTWTYED